MRVIKAIVFTFLAGLFAFSCVNSEDANKNKKYTAKEIYELIVNNTVTIYTDRALGSGFFIDSSIICTNYHVIQGAREAFIQLNNSPEKHEIVGYVAIDKVNDLVLLQTTYKSKQIIELESKVPSPGEKVFAIGSPEGLAKTISEGIVSSIRSLPEKKLLQITTPISHGSSGCPIINEEAKLIGVAVGAMKEGNNLNFCIPVNYLKTLIDFRESYAVSLDETHTVVPDKAHNVTSTENGKDNSEFVNKPHNTSLKKDKNYFIGAIGFYNVENLYDTINFTWNNDENFTPTGKNAWSGRRYWLKIDNLANVISQMATDVTPDGLSVLGLCEVGNKKALVDLVKHERLRERNYQVVHIEGSDKRSITPSFIYNPTYYKVTKSCIYKVLIESYKTRDILVISGLFAGEPMSFIVNHWPGRNGGELESNQQRILLAKAVRHIADSISTDNPNAKVAIIGDLNDSPFDESVKKYLNTRANQNDASFKKYFNPMEKLYNESAPTVFYEKKWNLFDQIIINENFLPGDFSEWNFYVARTFNKSFLRITSGKDEGHPLPTYIKGKYTGGYSDHFPVFIVIAKEDKR